MSYKHIALIAITIMLVCIPAMAVDDPQIFYEENFQGYKYYNETITIRSVTDVCLTPDPGSVPVGGFYSGFGRASGATTYPDIKGLNVTYTPYPPFLDWQINRGQGTAGIDVSIGTIGATYPEYWVGEVAICNVPIYGSTTVAGNWWILKAEEVPIIPPTEADYTCNFDPIIKTEISPFGLVCVDNSTGASPAVDTFSWTITQPDTSTYVSTNATLVKTLTDIGWYSMHYEACNAAGCANTTEPLFLNISQYAPPVSGIQTYFQAVNGQTNGAIYGSNLQLHDDETDTWSNVTADADGTHFITTNSTATIDGYADATGFSSVERLNLAPCATSGTCLYELIMWPDFMLPTPGSGLPGDPGTGNVNLVVIVSDKDSSAGIYMAQVTVADTSGSTQASYTNEAGTKIFAVSNSSTIHVTASKTGYSTVSKTTTTSAFGPDSVRIELTAAAGSATPTPIITDASGNIVPPAIQLTASEQDEDLMNTIRTNAPNLVMLFILFAVMYMLKGLMK